MSKYLAIFGKPRYLGIVTREEGEDELIKGDPVVVESYRGEEYAIVAGVLSEKQEKQYRTLKNSSESGDGIKNSEPVVTDLSFVKHASESDLEAMSEYADEEEEIFRLAKELLQPHKIEMKLIDVEYLRKKRKLFFYFSSDQRVDFRAYVRDLAREFKTRIELRQIGVRDEAKIIRGVAPCGQRSCCSYWLHQFAPINIRMVKEQNLALNPSKISGICGRLMCCMYYEHNIYHEIWSKLPNPGAKIKTPNGNVVVAGIDLQSKSVRCFVPGRGEVKVPTEQFDEFKQTVLDGREWELPAGDDTLGLGTKTLPLGKRTLTLPKRAEGDAAPQREKRAEPKEKHPETAASATEGRAKKKRRKRGRGGAASTETAAAEKTEPQKRERQAAPQPKEGDAVRRPRRHKRGGRSGKSEREGDN